MNSNGRYSNRMIYRNYKYPIHLMRMLSLLMAGG
jgi:hypothetical protein